MDREGILEDQTVIVRGQKIWQIGATNKIVSPEHALQIDGRGKYLIPGLADLHVHLFSADDLLSYAANGVTTVMNMDGGPMHLKWRADVRAGKLLGPTIYTAGHTVDGYPPLNEMFLTAETPEDGRAIVRIEKQQGYDFVKLYGTLRPDVFLAILEAARQENIRVVGHINRQVGALGVLKSSQVLAAHLEDLVFSRFDRPPNDVELEEFARAISASHMTVTPNLNVNPTNIAQLQDLDAVLKSPEAKLLPPAAFSQWMPTNNRNGRDGQTAQQIDQMNQVQKILYKLVSLLQAKGVRLVLGTDAAPYGFPGLSAHLELEELTQAGFTPYEALLTATRNSGSFIADSVPGAAAFGTITEGKEADLVLLSANPLAKIQNTKSIEGVMLRGRWLASTELGELRASADAHADPIKYTLEAVDAALEKGDVERAKRYSESIQSNSSWIAEWVLMTKARKLESTKLAAAIKVATWDTELYPQSFSAYYLLADLLFENGKTAAAHIQVRKSLLLEPHDSAALNLQTKCEAAKKPLLFTPVGTYHIQYTDRQSSEVRTTTLLIKALTKRQLFGEEKGAGEKASVLRSVYAGGNRLWAVSESQLGPTELRMVVNGNRITGDWAGSYGHNGKLSGTRTK